MKNIMHGMYIVINFRIIIVLFFTHLEMLAKQKLIIKILILLLLIDLIGLAAASLLREVLRSGQR